MSDQIYAVLITLSDDTLLLPNSAVAEVLPLSVLQTASGSADWLLGYCDWSDKRIPVINFEVLNGAAAGESGKRARIVIVHSLNAHLQTGALGILTQGYPHLVTLSREALVPQVLRESDRPDLVLSRVAIANHETAIPDLEAIEADIARHDFKRAGSATA
jgi:chemosensory pili system protein ChpC